MATKKYYHEKKNKGLCVMCGKANALPNKVHCKECAQRANEYRKKFEANHEGYHNKACKSRYWRLKEQGLCVQCGARPATDGRAECLQCRLRRSRLVEKRKEKSRGE